MIREQLSDIVSELEGSCSSLQSVCESNDIDFDSLTREELEYIDENIFECADCAWWYAVEEGHESDDGTICTDCKGSR